MISAFDGIKTASLNDPHDSRSTQYDWVAYVDGVFIARCASRAGALAAYKAAKRAR